MQRPTPLSPRNFVLSGACIGQRRLRHHSDKGVQRGVQLVDAIQARASQLDWRNFFSPQARSKISDRFQNGHWRS
jgi:hypothetical protein